MVFPILLFDLLFKCVLRVKMPWPYASTLPFRFSSKAQKNEILCGHSRCHPHQCGHKKSRSESAQFFGEEREVGPDGQLTCSPANVISSKNSTRKKVNCC
ncbi:unnamed protein product [Ectocarpus sp. 8 AP-2014]